MKPLTREDVANWRKWETISPGAYDHVLALLDRCEAAEREAMLRRSQLETLLLPVTKERDALASQVACLMTGMEMAWGVIANAGRGDWTLEHIEWREAAERWRDTHWHPAVKSLAKAAAEHDAAVRKAALEEAANAIARSLVMVESLDRVQTIAATCALVRALAEAKKGEP